MSQYPPSSAGPRTASDARRQESRRRKLEIRHGHLRRVHADEQDRASGAFPRVVDCSGQALAEPAPALRHDDEPVGDPAVGLTLEGDHRGSALLLPPTTSSVSANAAAATLAASDDVNGGHSLVLTVPASGSLAMTTTCTSPRAVPPWARVLWPRRASSQKGPHVRDGLHRSPGSARHLRTTGASPVDDLDLRNGPTRAVRTQDHFQRPPRSSILDSERDQGRPTGRPHRTEIAQRQRGTTSDLGHEQTIGQRGHGKARHPAGPPSHPR